MPKYTLYAWCDDDEGGLSICRAEKFEQKKVYTQFGFYTKQKIGDFDTAEELAELAEISLEEATEWLNEVIENIKMQEGNDYYDC